MSKQKRINEQNEVISRFYVSVISYLKMFCVLQNDGKEEEAENKYENLHTTKYDLLRWMTPSQQFAQEKSDNFFIGCTRGEKKNEFRVKSGRDGRVTNKAIK